MGQLNGGKVSLHRAGGLEGLRTAMAANHSKDGQASSVAKPDHVPQTIGDGPHGGDGSTAALVFDADARLIHVSGAFAKLVGIDPGSLIGSTHPFPWCNPNGSHRCRDRIQLLAGS